MDKTRHQYLSIDWKRCQIKSVRVCCMDALTGAQRNHGEASRDAFASTHPTLTGGSIVTCINLQPQLQKLEGSMAYLGNPLE